MTKHTIVIAGPLRAPYRTFLEENYNVFYLGDMDKTKAADVRAIVSVAGFDLSDNVFEIFNNLEVICNYGVGFDNINIDLATKSGVRVTNTPDVLTEDTADLAVILMLSLLRGVVKNDAYVRGGEWPRKTKLPLNVSPRGLKLGIVGLGRIGRSIAKTSEAFGMDISYFGPNTKNDVDYTYYSDLEKMAADVDVLSVACVGGEGTYHIVDHDVITALGKDGYIVNIARGSVIDEKALVKALQENSIAGAALDVFEDEPNVPDSLFEMDNVILQPHRGSATYNTRDAMADLVYSNLDGWFSKKKCTTLVN